MIMSNKNHIRIRMYRHGLGDCFLLRFPRTTGGPLHMVIDSGVLKGTPDSKARMTEVASDIAKETGGKLDLLVVTHEHWDHVSGFAEAREVWEKMNIAKIWLAWTEKPKHPLADKLRTEREAKKKEVVKKFAALYAQDASSLRLDGERSSRIAGLLGFLGAAPGSERVSGTTEALKFIVGQVPQPDYCFPGETLALPGVEGVRVFVLGPPVDEKLLKRSNPSRKTPEVYEDPAKPHAFAFDDGGDTDADMPFPSGVGRPVRGAKAYGSAYKAYFGKPEQPWQKLDFESILELERLALALDGDTNNTSLALAFELGKDGPVLLFPADAQVGNWISWQDVQWQVGAKKVKLMNDLFARTVLYKVGHHGSHNATMKEHGLEKMTHRDLIALVPVSKAMAKKKKWKMPFGPLERRLKVRTRGRILLADADVLPPDATKLDKLTSAERQRFKEMVTTTDLFHDITIPL
jgi:hypothetical protein